MEDYFSQPREALERDLRPEFGYQGLSAPFSAGVVVLTEGIVGPTLENTEKPKCTSDTACKLIIEALEPSQRPLDLSGSIA
jgi:hypothetical protein